MKADPPVLMHVRECQGAHLGGSASATNRADTEAAVAQHASVLRRTALRCGNTVAVGSWTSTMSLVQLMNVASGLKERPDREERDILRADNRVFRKSKLS